MLATIELYNRGLLDDPDRIVGAVLSLRTTSSGAPLWSVPVTSGTQNAGYTLTFKVGPTDSISGVSTALVAGATRTATGMVFDGVDGYVDLHLDAKVVGGPMTIVAVVRFGASTSSAAAILQCGNGGSDNIELKITSSGELRWAVEQGSAAAKHVDSAIVTGVWLHIAATVADQTMVVYINGVQQAENVNGWEPTTMTRSSCSLGKLASYGLNVEGSNPNGGWGGYCTCPDGTTHGVADNGNSCGSLACTGGTAGVCNQALGDWSYKSMTCGSAATTLSFPARSPPSRSTPVR